MCRGDAEFEFGVTSLHVTLSDVNLSPSPSSTMVKKAALPPIPHNVRTKIRAKRQQKAQEKRRIEEESVVRHSDFLQQLPLELLAEASLETT